MAIFNSYVKLPESTHHHVSLSIFPRNYGDTMEIDGAISMLFRLMIAIPMEISSYPLESSQIFDIFILYYHLVNVYITIENHHFQWVNQLFRLGHFQ